MSFKATRLRSAKDTSHVDIDNVFEAGDETLLRSVGIYGANGSGKSNIIRALEAFIDAIGAEPSPESTLAETAEPFRYGEHSEDSFFQIVLLLGGRKYRYGFTVRHVISHVDDVWKFGHEISSEWLMGTHNKNMKAYFTRKGMDVDLSDPLKDKEIPRTLPYPHTLFLTHVAAFDKDNACAEIRSYIRGLTISNFSQGFGAFRRHSFLAIETENKKAEFLAFLAQFNLRYDDIQLMKDNEKDPYRLDRVNFVKADPSRPKNRVLLNLFYSESAGTQRLFEIAGLLMRAFSMNRGGLIILDEIDSNFHPYFVMKIVKMFNDPTLNRSNCQLLFSSHDTNLLDPNILRRDQIYFTEKAVDESTRLYSLADLKGIRNDADFAKQYLAGFYGAVPLLNSLTDLSDN